MTARLPSTFLLTFHKCGSQWVRDLLADWELQNWRPVRAENPFTCNLNVAPFPAACAGELIGPIYNCSRDEWQKHALPDDRAILLVRDPRDIVVSLFYSINLSHAYTTELEARAHPYLLRLSRRESMFFLASRFHGVVNPFRSWFLRGDSRVHLVRYEDLVEDTRERLSKMFAFLEWPVPPEVVGRVVKRHDFKTRTGRSRGESEVFSHFRKGIPGEWREEFDRTFGACFARCLPALLMESGYEEDPFWFEKLSDRDDFPLTELAEAMKEKVYLQQENVRLREEVSQLRRICDERLRVIEQFHQAP